MKKIIPIILLLLSVNSYSQVNRYSKPAEPAKYEPITDRSYYEAKTQQSSNNISESSLNLLKKVNHLIESTNDFQFKMDLQKVNSYLKPLFGDKWISVYDAEWHMKKARKTYNKAVRKHNKRIRKK